jgi:hypothetical protein
MYLLLKNYFFKWITNDRVFVPFFFRGDALEKLYIKRGADKPAFADKPTFQFPVFIE